MRTLSETIVFLPFRKCFLKSGQNGVIYVRYEPTGFVDPTGLGTGGCIIGERCGGRERRAC